MSDVIDRFGITPSYYRADGFEFEFSHDVHKLLSDAPVRVDVHALREYFTFQNYYSGRTLFDGIRKQPPGTYAVRNGNKVSFVAQGKDFDFKPSAISYEESEQELRKLLNNAIKRHAYNRDVAIPLGGGMDSGIIVAFASRYARSINTITCGYFNQSDERANAELVASKFNTSHYEVLVGPRSLPKLLPGLISAVGDFRLSINYQDFIALSTASKFANVILSGAGGDELFGGYPWKYSSNDHYALASRLIKEHEHADFFTREVMDATAGYSPMQSYLCACRNNKTPVNIVDRFYFDIKSSLQGLLTYLHYYSRALNIKIEYPFLDDELVNFALKIPAQYKLNPVYGPLGKRILRDVMHELPTVIREAPKQGFTTPDSKWFRNETRDYIEGTLGKGSTYTKYIKYGYVHDKFNKHIAGVEDNHQLIWSLLCFEHWLRRFVA